MSAPRIALTPERRSLMRARTEGGLIQPDTRYAKCGELQIAYQIFGEGSVNLVIVPPFVSNVENFWDKPDFARWLRRLGSFARVLMFDKRGTGLSDRGSELPGLEVRIDDLRGVMDAVGFEKAGSWAYRKAGPLRPCLQPRIHGAVTH